MNLLNLNCNVYPYVKMYFKDNSGSAFFLNSFRLIKGENDVKNSKIKKERKQKNEFHGKNKTYIDSRSSRVIRK